MTSAVIGQPIVAGVDGSDPALLAVWWAAEEAGSRRVPLRLVHAIGLSGLSQPGWTGPSQDFYDTVRAEGRQDLVEIRSALAQAYPGLDIELDLRLADPVPTLVTESGTARLMVLGARGAGGFPGVLAGSTAVALAIQGHCPVAVIRGRGPGETPPADGPVVVGVDGSQASEPALALAFDEASWRGAELVAVHTWIEFPSERVYTQARRYFTDWDAIETRAREALAERLAGWQEKYPDVTVRRVITRNPPTRGLLEQAAQARLLVVGSRGHGGATGLLLGSTGVSLVHHATCPLLVVPSASAG